MKNIFVGLLQESVIMQGILSISVTGVWLYMLVAGVPVPESLTGVVGIVVGFFFGSKLALKQAE